MPSLKIQTALKVQNNAAQAAGSYKVIDGLQTRMRDFDKLAAKMSELAAGATAPPPDQDLRELLGELLEGAKTELGAPAWHFTATEAHEYRINCWVNEEGQCVPPGTAPTSNNQAWGVLAPTLSGDDFDVAWVVGLVRP